jgi:ABC-type glycerol-3-phosphate transport system substrate-binding protein
MYGIFGAQYPNVNIINATVAGGAGSNAKAVLTTRMQSGDPPDSFQVHAGHELIDTWVVADKMEPVTFIFEENGWLDSYPPGVIDVLSYDGEIWSVPVNIHRSNVLWYNMAIFEENGLSAPTTFDEFFAAADTLQAAGVTPLALGDNGIWTATHLMESVLLGAGAGGLPRPVDRRNRLELSRGDGCAGHLRPHDGIRQRRPRRSVVGPGRPAGGRRRCRHDHHGRLGPGLLHLHRPQGQ